MSYKEYLLITLTFCSFPAFAIESNVIEKINAQCHKEGTGKLELLANASKASDLGMPASRKASIRLPDGNTNSQSTCVRTGRRLEGKPTQCLDWSIRSFASDFSYLELIEVNRDNPQRAYRCNVGVNEEAGVWKLESKTFNSLGELQSSTVCASDFQERKEVFNNKRTKSTEERAKVVEKHFSPNFSKKESICLSNQTEKKLSSCASGILSYGSTMERCTQNIDKVLSALNACKDKKAGAKASADCNLIAKDSVHDRGTLKHYRRSFASDEELSLLEKTTRPDRVGEEINTSSATEAMARKHKVKTEFDKEDTQYLCSALVSVKASCSVTNPGNGFGGRRMHSSPSKGVR